MTDARTDIISPERIATSRPVAFLRSISELPEGRQVIEIWVCFRGEDHFPAAPIIDVTELTPDEEQPHLSRFKGIELTRSEHEMAWGDGVEVNGIVNEGRGAVVLMEVGGVAIAPEHDTSFMLEP